jgi:exodeoxyribonuclease-3
MSITLASWNVNSVRVRMPQIETWLESRPADLLALQETKTPDPLFPAVDFHARGFTSVYRGQAAYNGVAILAREPLDRVEDELDPAFPDRRFLSAQTGSGFHLVNIYAPNGESLESDKFRYKCAWYAALVERLRGLLRIHPKLALVGDFNLAPAGCDVYDPEAFEGSVLTDPRIRCYFAELEALGLVDAYRYQHPDQTAFSWWDYRRGAARRGEGLRIDLILLSEALLPRLRQSGIAEEIRSHPRPSDHAPVWVELDP